MNQQPQTVIIKENDGCFAFIGKVIVAIIIIIMALVFITVLGL